MRESRALEMCGRRVGAPCVTGLLSVRLLVSAEGKVVGIERLADTLVVDPQELDAGDDPEEARSGVLTAIVEALDSASFAPCEDGETTITIPFTFD